MFQGLNRALILLLTTVSVWGSNSLCEVSCKPPQRPPSKAIGHPFFYEISSGNKSSFLIGTFHLGVSLVDLPPIVETRLSESRLFATEKVISHEQIKQFIDDPIAVFRAHPSDSTKVNEADAEKLTCYGVPKVIAKEVSDFNCTVVLYAPLFFPHPQSLDLELIDKARALSKPLVSLDTKKLMEQYHKAEADAEPSPCSVTRDILSQTPGQVLKAGLDFSEKYRSGDEATMNMDQDTGVALRNVAWVPKLVPELKEGGVFIAVGAGHLFGPLGVINLLKARGFRIQRVGVTP